MKPLQLTSTATALSACLLALFVASSIAAPLEVHTRGGQKSSCLLQRHVEVKIQPNTSLIQNVVTSATLSTTAADHGISGMSEATRWLSDIFDEEVTPFMNITTVRRAHLHPVQWSRKDKGFFICLTIALVGLDFFLLQRLDLSGLRQHLALVGFWTLVGIGYNIVVFAEHGSVAGVQWCSGYTLEWLLSIDNLFVFHLIFRLYKTPTKVIHKALFFGIFGAVIFRFALFALVRQLLDLVTWFRFVFGAFLIWSGIQAAKEEEEEASETQPIIFLRWLLGSRLHNSYGEEQEGNLIMWKDGRATFTLLLPVVCCLECTDLIFAVDSVSAKAAQIPDLWASATSAILAMFALRAMFFVVQDLVQLFGLLKYGLCFILLFIGVELMISDYVALPPHVVCVVILSVFSISIIGSTAMHREPAPAEGLLDSSLKSASSP